MESEKYSSLNKLLDALYLQDRSYENDAAMMEDLEKTKANIIKQRELSDIMKIKTESSALAAQMIFENMNAINQIIAYMKKNRRPTLEELRNAFKDIKIISIDLKNKTVKIDV